MDAAQIELIFRRASMAALRRKGFYRIFKSAMGETLARSLDWLRIDRANRTAQLGPNQR
jgi:transcriptional regulator GlxA family with amidase domain